MAKKDEEIDDIPLMQWNSQNKRFVSAGEAPGTGAKAGAPGAPGQNEAVAPGATEQNEAVAPGATEQNQGEVETGVTRPGNNNADGLNGDAAPDDIDSTLANRSDAYQATMPTKVAGAPEGYKVGAEEHNQRMQNPDYASLYAVDPIAADQAWKTMTSEGLDKTIASRTWAEETDEQRKQREKREHNARMIAGLGSMVGALGNMYTASSSRNGRAVAVPDLTTGVNAGVKEANAKREAAFKELSAARRRKSDILTAGYANAEKRKQNERAYQLQKAEAERKAANDTHKMRMDLAKYQLEVEKLNGQQAQQAAQRELWKSQEKYYQARRAELGGKSTKEDTVFYLGNDKLSIPKNEYDSAMYSAYGKLPDALKKQALEEVFRHLPVDEQDKLGGIGGLLGGNGTERFVNMHAKDMHAALEIVINEPGAEAAADIIRNAARSNGGKKTLPGHQNDQRTEIPGF